ncbi:hypothetical protein MOP88_00410 [Sphingomonas sp. WKB10]|nr:hypothetical protein [Sphingomonas sp. WKB10]
MHKALFVGIEAGPTHQEDAAEFLRGALEPVEHEQDTRHWYALRLAPPTSPSSIPSPAMPAG